MPSTDFSLFGFTRIKATLLKINALNPNPESTIPLLSPGLSGNQSHAF
mgnify:CR=1 FL=1